MKQNKNKYNWMLIIGIALFLIAIILLICHIIYYKNLPTTNKIVDCYDVHYNQIENVNCISKEKIDKFDYIPKYVIIIVSISGIMIIRGITK